MSPDLLSDTPPVPPRRRDRKRHTPPRPISNGLPPTPKVHMGACFSKVSLHKAKILYYIFSQKDCITNYYMYYKLFFIAVHKFFLYLTLYYKLLFGYTYIICYILFTLIIFSENTLRKYFYHIVLRQLLIRLFVIFITNRYSMAVH